MEKFLLIYKRILWTGVALSGFVCTYGRKRVETVENGDVFLPLPAPMTNRPPAPVDTTGLEEPPVQFVPFRVAQAFFLM